MGTPTLIRNYTAGAAVTKCRIVKHGAADGAAVQAAAATDALLGICSELDAASGARMDVVKAGIADVEYGGNVTRGDPLTSDANGKAVTAAPVAGANARIVGFAEVSGVAGDIGSCDIAPGLMQG